jgi:hypothetical protein
MPYISTYDLPGCAFPVNTTASTYRLGSYSAAGYGNGVSPCVTASNTYSAYSSPLPQVSYQLTCYGGYHIGADWQLTIYNTTNPNSTGCSGSSVTIYGHGSQCINMASYGATSTSSSVQSLQIDCSGLGSWSPQALGPPATYRVAVAPNSKCNFTNSQISAVDTAGNPLMTGPQFYSWSALPGSSQMMAVQCQSNSPLAPFALTIQSAPNTAGIGTALSAVSYSYYQRGVSVSSIGISGVCHPYNGVSILVDCSSTLIPLPQPPLNSSTTTTTNLTSVLTNPGLQYTQTHGGLTLTLTDGDFSLLRSAQSVTNGSNFVQSVATLAGYESGTWGITYLGVSPLPTIQQLLGYGTATSLVNNPSGAGIWEIDLHVGTATVLTPAAMNSYINVAFIYSNIYVPSDSAAYLNTPGLFAGYSSRFFGSTVQQCTPATVSCSGVIFNCGPGQYPTNPGCVYCPANSYCLDGSVPPQTCPTGEQLTHSALSSSIAHWAGLDVNHVGKLCCCHCHCSSTPTPTYVAVS